MLNSTKYKLSLNFTEKLLGSQPGAGTPASDYIKDHVRNELLKKAKREGKDKNQAETDVNKIIEEEEINLSIEMEKGMTMFHRDEQGNPILFNYQIKGLIKECAESLNGINGIKQLKSKIEKTVFISTRRIPINGKVGEPLERSIRVMTMQGPRVSLVKSEVIEAGASIECELEIIELPKIKVDEELLRTLLEYGLRIGVGQWRNSGIYGQYTYTLTPQK